MRQKLNETLQVTQFKNATEIQKVFRKEIVEMQANFEITNPLKTFDGQSTTMNG